MLITMTIFTFSLILISRLPKEIKALLTLLLAIFTALMALEVKAQKKKLNDLREAPPHEIY